ncbi:MAG: CoA transferase [Alphaproteobacteria bacterium]|jgi:crotonobetainyl-CoA:carnitine CoA-transferase CaiB-like acyl-CoA transferase|nr:CoA transferase [Alphaproteobacteria bacterium]MDP6566540.1 CoA transferase [Alphaproteobacteria bacterium]MDP6815952.1 CoA transferase [Alphaproteobacteria bacterium]
MSADGWGALAGLRVIDLTQMLAGPFCTMLLADQGAEVIKVEPPDGDQTRRAGMHLAGDEERLFGGYFQSINRNKKSIAIDLKTEDGKAILHNLVTDADVLVENFRAGTMEGLGLSYESLAEINPRLVYATIRGFGDPRTGASPYADWPAFDVVAQAMGGIMSITGPEPDRPMKVGPGVGDTVPAMLLTIGILSAVHHAGRTGQGQFVDVAMYDGILALCERIVHQHSYGGVVPGPEGNAHPLLCPFGMFPAKDGWISIACPRDHFWVILTEIMGRPELGTDPHYLENVDRSARNDEVVAIVSDWTRELTKAELIELLGGKVPFGPVNTVADIVSDPHVEARHMLAEVSHPGNEHTVKIANTPIHMNKTQGGVHRRTPTLSQDADDVLAAAGYDAAEIARLRESGVII